MNSTTIDASALNSLFDKQKKLDDIFSSMFEEDEFNFINNSVSNNDQVIESSSWDDDKSPYNEDLSINSRNDTLEQKKQSIIHIALPLVLEIAAIYYAISYFS